MWYTFIVRVLITGTSGFVGGALGAWLRASGCHSVTGVSRSAAREGSVDQWFEHDLGEPLPAVLGRHDAIVHCAALSSPWASPAAYRIQNVEATRNVVRYAEETGSAKLVFLSSSSVYYRHGDQTGITEDTPFPEPPINEYAATKREAERLVLAAKVPSVVLRPRAVFGPGDTVLFPRILRAARRGVMARFTRPDGVPPRGDLIYIDNLSRYIERALESDERGCFNLTDGAPVDLWEFIGTVFERAGLPPVRRKIPVSVAFALAGALEFVSRRLLGYREPPITRFGVEVLAYSKTFDVAKAVRAFGLPQVGTQEGLERFVAWLRSRP